MKKNPKYLTIAKFTYLERGTLSDIKDILLCWNILIGIYIWPYLTETGAKVTINNNTTQGCPTLYWLLYNVVIIRRKDGQLKV